MIAYISGGAKNGKSTYAEELAVSMSKEKSLPLYYIATMIPHDEEDNARIARHIRERDGKGFETVECGLDIENAYRGEGVYLLDSVTALLSNEMFREDGSVDRDAPGRISEELKSFALKAKNVVFVSDYIYSDATNFDELTELYRKGLARIDREVSKICHKVTEVTFGRKIEYKG